MKRIDRRFSLLSRGRTDNNLETFFFLSNDTDSEEILHKLYILKSNQLANSMK